MILPLFFENFIILGLFKIVTLKLHQVYFKDFNIIFKNKGHWKEIF